MIIDFCFQGCKIKMDDSGNILIKRIAKANVFVKISDGENAVSNEIVKLPSGTLELDKPVKLFDMKKFQQNVAKELKRAYPDRRKLECQVCADSYNYFRNVLMNKINLCHEEIIIFVSLPSVHLRSGLCEERERHPGAALLGDAHQHCRHGHAQVKDSSRLVRISCQLVVDRLYQ